MTRKGQSITLSLAEQDKAKLEQLAAEFGMTWGEKPNISKLVKAIARSQLRIAPNHDWPQHRIEALELARQALIDAGKLPEAQEIAALLCDRSELNLPFRQKLTDFLAHPQPQWRQELDRLILRRQPFRLVYQDAQEREWRYTVLHARIQPIEKRQYLLARCQESEGNMDIPQLSHNWTLRLDRIFEAAIAPIQQRWLSEPELVPVTFHLYNRLALAYDRKPDDIEVTLNGDPPVRRVVRNIYNTFWFLREIAPYWGDCEIITPESVRLRHQQKIESCSNRYSSSENTPDPL
ncbi:MAG: WYL domain-containing protein [Cyanobacteriota bacterium]|nr:WYL domain-containing protein [Cyanobacteriota bacterium]